MEGSMKKPRKLSAVRITEEALAYKPGRYWKDGKGKTHDRYKVLLEAGQASPSSPGGYFLYLGEIPNVPEHCAIVGIDGKVRFLYHTEEFRELTEDET